MEMIDGNFWGSGVQPHVAKFADAVYVLHCFQKKTEKTNKADLDLAAKRYRDLLQELG
jgi:phage-related protein